LFTSCQQVCGVCESTDLKPLMLAYCQGRWPKIWNDYFPNTNLCCNRSILAQALKHANYKGERLIQWMPWGSYCRAFLFLILYLKPRLKICPSIFYSYLIYTYEGPSSNSAYYRALYEQVWASAGILRSFLFSGSDTEWSGLCRSLFTPAETACDAHWQWGCGTWDAAWTPSRREKFVVLVRNEAPFSVSAWSLCLVAMPNQISRFPCVYI
jgi:hypothetical protein